MKFPLILLVFLWLLFFASHSWLASERIKNWSYRHIGLSKKSYRLFYSVLSTFLVGSIYAIPHFYPEKQLFVFSFGLKLIFIFVLILGGIIAALPFRYISGSEFIGLKAPKEESSKTITPLVLNGIYKWVRHPIYSGLILVYFAWFGLFPTLYNAINTLLILLYLPIGIYLEEQKLIAHFGSSYLHYKQEVKAIIPKIL